MNDVNKSPTTASSVGGFFQSLRKQALLIGFGLGAITGLAFGPHTAILSPVADLFIAALKILGPPVALLTALISLVQNKLGYLGFRAIIWYFCTTLLTAAIGIGIAYSFQVGSGFLIANGITETATSTQIPILTEKLANGLRSFLNGPLLYLLGYILLLTLMSIRYRRSETSADTPQWQSLLQSFTQISYQLLRWLMYLAPIGVFALIAVTLGKLQLAATQHLLVVMLTVYLAQIIAFIACLMLLRACAFAPVTFLRDTQEALLTAFATGSSAATMPVEFAVAEIKLGINWERVGLVLTLGLAIHKLGSAAYQAIIIIFAANAIEQQLTFEWLACLTLLTVVASAITPPVSGGSWAALGVVFGIAGLPIVVIAIAGSIPFVGKLNTPLNSLGRLMVTLILNDYERPSAQLAERNSVEA